MRKIILISTILLGFLPTKAVFTNFASPNKKTIPLKTTKKPFIKKSPKSRKHKIQDARIWQIPQREFLGKAFSQEEEDLIEIEALERFIESASLKNPEAYKVYRSKNKNSQLRRNITSIISNRSNSNILNHYFENRNSQKQEQIEIVVNEIKSIKKLYKDLKKIYSPQNKNSKAQYEELKTKITACCGLENFLYIENLLKREIQFEVFNT